MTGIFVFLINSTGTFPASSRAKMFLPVSPSTISHFPLGGGVQNRPGDVVAEHQQGLHGHFALLELARGGN